MYDYDLLDADFLIKTSIVESVAKFFSGGILIANPSTQKF